MSRSTSEEERNRLREAWAVFELHHYTDEMPLSNVGVQTWFRLANADTEAERLIIIQRLCTLINQTIPASRATDREQTSQARQARSLSYQKGRERLGFNYGFGKGDSRIFHRYSPFLIHSTLRSRARHLWINDDTNSSALTVALDAGYLSYNPKSSFDVLDQLQEATLANLWASDPARLHITSFPLHKPVYQPAIQTNGWLRRLELQTHADSFAQLFPGRKIHFLSPDAKKPLELPRSEDVYVISPPMVGMPNRHFQNQQSRRYDMQLCLRLGLQPERVPMELLADGPFLPSRTSRSPVIFPAKFYLKALLLASQYGDWRRAVNQAFPPKLLSSLSHLPRAPKDPEI